MSLLNKLLTYDPAKRLTARAALRHSYFQEQPPPKQPADFPTFPSAHDTGVLQKHQRRCQTWNNPVSLLALVWLYKCTDSLWHSIRIM